MKKDIVKKTVRSTRTPLMWILTISAIIFFSIMAAGTTGNGWWIVAVIGVFVTFIFLSQSGLNFINKKIEGDRMKNITADEYYLSLLADNIHPQKAASITRYYFPGFEE